MFSAPVCWRCNEQQDGKQGANYTSPLESDSLYLDRKEWTHVKWDLSAGGQRLPIGNSEHPDSAGMLHAEMQDLNIKCESSLDVMIWQGVKPCQNFLMSFSFLLIDRSNCSVEANVSSHSFCWHFSTKGHIMKFLPRIAWVKERVGVLIIVYQQPLSSFEWILSGCAVARAVYVILLFSHLSCVWISCEWSGVLFHISR